MAKFFLFFFDQQPMTYMFWSRPGPLAMPGCWQLAAACRRDLLPGQSQTGRRRPDRCPGSSPRPPLTHLYCEAERRSPLVDGRRQHFPSLACYSFRHLQTLAPHGLVQSRVTNPAAHLSHSQKQVPIGAGQRKVLPSQFQ